MLAYAQLLRIPNVFTAFADIVLAACAAGYLCDDPLKFLILLFASGSLYCGGMVWNDIFDRHDDAKARPQRPLPSGRVSLRDALLIAITLTLLGLLLAALADQLVIASVLAALIIAYDTWLKHTPLGPIAMGGCRALNIVLGLTGAASDDITLHLAATTGLYITGVTLFARTEEGRSEKRTLLCASIVILAALLLGVALPVNRPPDSTPFLFVYLMFAFGVSISVKLIAAIRDPGPKQVQAAVKRCILGLILLDAILAFLFISWPGLLIVLLLLPARWLGQWVYST